MSLRLQKAGTPSGADAQLPLAMIESVAEELHQTLNSIQAIAYYVEMTLPLSELTALQHLQKVQCLVDECAEMIGPFVQHCRVTGNGPAEAEENDQGGHLGESGAALAQPSLASVSPDGGAA